MSNSARYHNQLQVELTRRHLGSAAQYARALAVELERFAESIEASLPSSSWDGELTEGQRRNLNDNLARATMDAQHGVYSLSRELAYGQAAAGQVSTTTEED